MKKERFSVLIVDDDKNTRDGLQYALRREWKVFVAESAEVALTILDDEDIDILLSDVRMPVMDGITLMQRAIAKTPGLIAILLTAYGSVETAVQAMKNGAYDFLMKPVNLDHLDMLLKRSVRTREVETENVRLKERLDKKFGLENIIGSSQGMNDVFDVVRQVAPTQVTVLVQGESGTGKELVANAIHKLSHRKNAPFVAVHCAALSSSLLESELFGHEKGSFTGATSRRKGRFESADGGTLFLDEISEIAPEVQVKLLRVLEEHTFERVGGSDLIDVDIRLIAATNKDLKTLVKEGKFREDLFFRLDVVDVILPPLRTRPDDVALLCDHFIADINIKNDTGVEGITPDALNMLCAYSWPGNVRELRNTLEKMAVMAKNRKLTARDIPPGIREEIDMPLASSKNSGAGGAGGSLENAERDMILSALERNANNITRTAEQLGISRRTLHRKLNKYRG